MYICLPKQIANKKAIVNVINNDEKCFIWTIFSAIYPVEKNPNRLSNYNKQEYLNQLNLSGIEFPMKLSQIEKLENQNKMSINIYALEKYHDNFKIVPGHLTKHKKTQHVNMLMI